MLSGIVFHKNSSMKAFVANFFWNNGHFRKTINTWSYPACLCIENSIIHALLLLTKTLPYIIFVSNIAWPTISTLWQTLTDITQDLMTSVNWPDKEFWPIADSVSFGTDWKRNRKKSAPDWSASVWPDADIWTRSLIKDLLYIYNGKARMSVCHFVSSGVWTKWVW